MDTDIAMPNDATFDRTGSPVLPDFTALEQGGEQALKVLEELIGKINDSRNSVRELTSSMDGAFNAWNKTLAESEREFDKYIKTVSEAPKVFKSLLSEAEKLDRPAKEQVEIYKQMLQQVDANIRKMKKWVTEQKKSNSAAHDTGKITVAQFNAVNGKIEEVSKKIAELERQKATINIGINDSKLKAKIAGIIQQLKSESYSSEGFFGEQREKMARKTLEMLKKGGVRTDQNGNVMDAESISTFKVAAAAIGTTIIELSNLAKQYAGVQKEIAEYKKSTEMAAHAMGMIDSSPLERLSGDLDLTRSQAAAFYDVLDKGASVTGKTVSELGNVAKVLKETFGGDVTKQLQQYIELLKEVPTLVEDLNGGSSEDQTAALYAIAKSGKAGDLNALMPSGLFGGGQKRQVGADLLDASQDANKKAEQVGDFLIGLLPMWTPYFAKLPDVVDLIGKVGGSAVTILGTMKAISVAREIKHLATLGTMEATNVTGFTGVISAILGQDVSKHLKDLKDIKNIGSKLSSKIGNLFGKATGGSAGGATAGGGATATGTAAGGLSAAGIAGGVAIGAALVGLGKAMEYYNETLKDGAKSLENEKWDAGDVFGAVLAREQVATAKTRESVGAGAAIGGGIGAAIGTAVAGPVGAAVAGAIGAVIGGGIGYLKTQSDLENYRKVTQGEKENQKLKNYLEFGGDSKAMVAFKSPEMESFNREMAMAGDIINTKAVQLAKSARSLQDALGALEAGVKNSKIQFFQLEAELGSLTIQRAQSFGGSTSGVQKAIGMQMGAAQKIFETKMGAVNRARNRVATDNTMSGEAKQALTVQAEKEAQSALMEFVNATLKAAEAIQNLPEYMMNAISFDAFNEIVNNGVVSDVGAFLQGGIEAWSKSLDEIAAVTAERGKAIDKAQEQANKDRSSRLRTISNTVNGAAKAGAKKDLSDQERVQLQNQKHLLLVQNARKKLLWDGKKSFTDDEKAAYDKYVGHGGENFWTENGKRLSRYTLGNFVGADTAGNNRKIDEIDKRLNEYNSGHNANVYVGEKYGNQLSGVYKSDGSIDEDKARDLRVDIENDIAERRKQLEQYGEAGQTALNLRKVSTNRSERKRLDLERQEQVLNGDKKGAAETQEQIDKLDAEFANNLAPSIEKLFEGAGMSEEQKKKAEEYIGENGIERYLALLTSKDADSFQRKQATGIDDSSEVGKKIIEAVTGNASKLREADTVAAQLAALENTADALRSDVANFNKLRLQVMKEQITKEEKATADLLKGFDMVLAGIGENTRQLQNLATSLAGYVALGDATGNSGDYAADRGAEMEASTSKVKEILDMVSKAPETRQKFDEKIADWERQDKKADEDVKNKEKAYNDFLGRRKEEDLSDKDKEKAKELREALVTARATKSTTEMGVAKAKAGKTEFEGKLAKAPMEMANEIRKNVDVTGQMSSRMTSVMQSAAGEFAKALQQSADTIFDFAGYSEDFVAATAAATEYQIQAAHEAAEIQMKAVDEFAKSNEKNAEEMYNKVKAVEFSRNFEKNKNSGMRDKEANKAAEAAAEITAQKAKEKTLAAGLVTVENERLKIAGKEMQARKKAITQQNDLVRRSIDYQQSAVDSALDFAENFGGSWSEVLQLQNMSVELERQKYDLAIKEFEEAKAQGVKGVELQELQTKAIQAGVNLRKKEIGVAKSMMDRMLGAAFGQIRSSVGARRQMGSVQHMMGVGNTRILRGDGTYTSGEPRTVQEGQLARQTSSAFGPAPGETNMMSRIGDGVSGAMSEMTKGLYDTNNHMDILANALNDLTSEVGKLVPGADRRYERWNKRYATGTWNAESGPQLVGEHGPEIVMMEGGETVLNHSETKELEYQTTKEREDLEYELKKAAWEQRKIEHQKRMAEADKRIAATKRANADTQVSINYVQNATSNPYQSYATWVDPRTGEVHSSKGRDSGGNIQSELDKGAPKKRDSYYERTGISTREAMRGSALAPSAAWQMMSRGDKAGNAAHSYYEANKAQIEYTKSKMDSLRDMGWTLTGNGFARPKKAHGRGRHKRTGFGLSQGGGGNFIHRYNTKTGKWENTGHKFASFYAAGTKNAKKGPAVVGEKGTEEVYKSGFEGANTPYAKFKEEVEETRKRIDAAKKNISQLEVDQNMNKSGLSNPYQSYATWVDPRTGEVHSSKGRDSGGNIQSELDKGAPKKRDLFRERTGFSLREALGGSRLPAGGGGLSVAAQSVKDAGLARMGGASFAGPRKAHGRGRHGDNTLSSIKPTSWGDAKSWRPSYEARTTPSASVASNVSAVNKPNNVSTSPRTSNNNVSGNNNANSNTSNSVVSNSRPANRNSAQAGRNEEGRKAENMEIKATGEVMVHFDTKMFQSEMAPLVLQVIKSNPDVVQKTAME